MTRGGEAVSAVRERYDGQQAIVVRWDFTVRGGTFGAEEAAVFELACRDAATTRTPLVTVLRSGGTRLQEGMRALVGIPRAVLALQQLADAHVPHVCVADHPTTGGVWVAIGSGADVRAAVAGATVAFSGPRVVQAMTGVELPPGANTAESAAAAGLVDAVLAAGEITPWLTGVLRALAADTPQPTTATTSAPPERHGWSQVEHSRRVARPDGVALVDAMLTDAVRLRGGDASVAAALGRLLGRRVVVVAVAAKRAGRVSPAGYHLLERAAGLADRLALPVVTLVDTAGADPLPASEQAGVASAMRSAMVALLACHSTTVTVVHGEGGSGGALAAATTDIVAVTDDAWFAALAPEGAAAALRTTPRQAADLMRIAPLELIFDGFADAVAPTGAEPLRDWLAALLDELAGTDPVVRRDRRLGRWRAQLSPGLPDGSGSRSSEMTNDTAKDVT